MAERPVWPMSSTPSEALNFLGPSPHRLEDSLQTTSAQGFHIFQRNMTRSPRRRRDQVINEHIMEPVGSHPRVRQHQPESSHGLDPGSILVNGFVRTKARRPNASGERDKSRSTTPREHISFGFDLSSKSSWEIRFLWASYRSIRPNR